MFNNQCSMFNIHLSNRILFLLKQFFLNICAIKFPLNEEEYSIGDRGFFRGSSHFL